MPILRVMHAGGATVGIAEPNFAIVQGTWACRFRIPAHGLSQVSERRAAPHRFPLGYGVKIKALSQ